MAGSRENLNSVHINAAFYDRSAQKNVCGLVFNVLFSVFGIKGINGTKEGEGE